MFCPECNTYLEDIKDEWFTVSFYLFMGLSSMIDHYSKKETVTEKELNDIENAVEIYIKNCVVSSDGLEDKFKKLKNKNLN